MEANKHFPGTTIATDAVNRRKAEEVLGHIFAGGDIYRSQVTALTGIEQHSIQNWVARGFVSHPKNKQYSKRQLCRLIIINLLSDTLKIGDITDMLSYVNGNLSDEGDDTIPDDVLYGCFAEMCQLNEGNCIIERIEETSNSVTDELTYLGDEDRKKVAEVLRTMIYAYRSAEMNKVAHTFLDKIKNNRNITNKL